MVAHLLPSTSEGPRLYTASARKTFDASVVGPPYGSDLIVAIASSLPLGDQLKSPSEEASAYLGRLRAAIDDVRKRGGRVAVDAMVFDALPR